MRYEFEPLGNWTDPVTADRPTCRFKTSYDDTLGLLDSETEKLGASLVVIQIDVTRDQIRRDGLPRASARPDMPGVRVSFDSDYGPLAYATDRFPDWRDNLRAIALSLQALRAVDRYGVNERGQQYTGWLAIGAGPNMDEKAARKLLDTYGGEKLALKATHPDMPGGSDAAFENVQLARRVLAGAS